jgi:Sec-independent protein translocase protein TatA
MFNVSWGELAVLAGISLAVIGRRDLPKVAYMAGTQVGRVVGLLQGARARADRFAAQSELKQLQNELRSGLRELDAVKSELAVSMSPSAMIGRTLGPMTSNANNISRASIMPQQQSPMSEMKYTATTSEMNYGSGNSNSEISQAPIHSSSPPLSVGAPMDQSFMSQSAINQSSLAVAEQVWTNQGIGFSSAAERGVGLASSNTGYNRDQAGSVILSKLLQESLIFDQYDRIVAEQNAALQSKVSTIQEKYDAKKEGQ